MRIHVRDCVCGFVVIRTLRGVGGRSVGAQSVVSPSFQFFRAFRSACLRVQVQPFPLGPRVLKLQYYDFPADIHHRDALPHGY